MKEAEVYATIQDLEINPKRKVNFIEKKQFAEIIQGEFANQRTIYDAQISEAREKLIRDYKESIGYDKLKKKLSQVEREVLDIKKEISDLGIDDYGNLKNSFYFNKDEQNTATYRRLQAVEKGIQALQDSKPLNLQNKIISRLWLCDTMGEVIVILNQVLGNGMIPKISKERLALMYKAEEKK